MMGGVIRSGLRRALAPVSLASIAVIATLIGLGPAPRSALALPPAGTDVLAAYGQTTIESRLGSETITLNGTVTIQRSGPYLDNGVEVEDAQITSMNLTGTSLIGQIAVVLNSGQSTLGELRSLQPPPTEFPATSFFDVYARVTIPANPSPTVQLQNLVPIPVTVVGDISEWPPVQEKFASTALQGVDNDADTQVDEDTSDEDGDHMYDEDGPGLGGCVYTDCDTDGRVDEDPAIGQCTLLICDADGDTLVDEDPACYPLFPTLPAGACMVSISLTLYAEADKDGCTNAAELQTAPGSQASGGRRDPNYYWDFMDVPTGSPSQRDRAVTVGDIGGVVARFGSNGDPGGDPLTTPLPAPTYHTAYDRAGSNPGGDTWDLLPPDGIISVGDIGAAVVQFGHTCILPPQ